MNEYKSLLRNILIFFFFKTKKQPNNLKPNLFFCLKGKFCLVKN